MEADVEIINDSVMEVIEIPEAEQIEAQDLSIPPLIRNVDEPQAFVEIPASSREFVDVPVIEQNVIVLLRDLENYRDVNQQVIIEPPPPQQPETPKSRKKRRRSPGAVTPKSPKRLDDSDDDGCTCPICLDNWQMCGDHRLISLKCGHLFGHSCIKRWMQECSSGHKCCPSCKTKATNKDIRFLFAKKVCAEDNSEEIRLSKALDEERKKCSNFQLEIGVIRMELELQKKYSSKLELKVRELELTGGGPSTSSMNSTLMSSQFDQKHYRLFMEKNVEICKDIGCKVMVYGEKCFTLLISQKSTQSLFPGYGIRYVDVPSFRPTSFIHLSSKGVKDICYDANNDLFIAATMERTAKLFNINNKSVACLFSPSEDPLWACAFDPDKDKILYLGSQKGNSYIHDIRNPSQVIQEFKAEGDYSPVINICAIKVNCDFPYGGFLVCKLTSVWFHEYKSDQTVDATRLNVEGPFLSMNYNQKSGQLLISTRPNASNSTCRHIVGKVVKLNEIIGFEPEFTFLGSRVQTGITKAAQLSLETDTIVTAYIQDTKSITLWGVCTGNRKLQSLPVQESVHDIVPIYVDHQTYFAALTDNKCRVYRFSAE